MPKTKKGLSESELEMQEYNTMAKNQKSKRQDAAEYIEEVRKEALKKLAQEQSREEWGPDGQEAIREVREKFSKEIQELKNYVEECNRRYEEEYKGLRQFYSQIGGEHREAANGFQDIFAELKREKSELEAIRSDIQKEKEDLAALKAQMGGMETTPTITAVKDSLLQSAKDAADGLKENVTNFFQKCGDNIQKARDGFMDKCDSIMAAHYQRAASLEARYAHSCQDKAERATQAMESLAQAKKGIKGFFRAISGKGKEVTEEEAKKGLFQKIVDRYSEAAEKHMSASNRYFEKGQEHEGDILGRKQYWEEKAQYSGDFYERLEKGAKEAEREAREMAMGKTDPAKATEKEL